MAMLYGAGLDKIDDRWLEKGCMSFDQTIDKLSDDQRQIEDFNDSLANWDVEADLDGVYFRHLTDDRRYKPTDHALGLICQVGRGMSVWAVRALRDPIGHPTKKDENGKPIPIDGGERSLADYECLRDYIKIHLFDANRVDQKKPRLFRTWNDGTLRAVLSDKYCIVNNVWFMEVLRELIPGGMICHWKGDADTIYGNVLIPDTIREEDDSELGGMLSIGNSEIGTRRICSLPSVFRSICMNGCIWGQEKGTALSRVHRGTIDFDQLKTAIKENLESQIPLLPQGIERLLGLRAFGCGDTPSSHLLAQLSIDYGLSKRQTSAVHNGWLEELGVIGTDDGRTAYGLTNAVTRAGQQFDPELWVKFDTIAGNMTDMDRDEWDRFRSRAGGLSDKQVEKRLGELVAA